MGAGEPLSGVGFDWDSIAAVVLGGTALTGGRGGIGGTIGGVAIISILNNVMNLAGVSSFTQIVIKGIIVLIAVLLAAGVTRRVAEGVAARFASVDTRGRRRGSVTAVSEAEAPSGARGWLGTIRRHQSIVGPWVILLLLVVVSTLISPDFLSTTNLLNILRQAAPLMIVALGQTLVILVGGIDVSVGALIATTTVIGGSLMRDSDALILPTVLIVIGVGVVVGLIDYVFIVRFRTDALVTTLGTMLILTGLNLIYTGGVPAAMSPICSASCPRAGSSVSRSS